VQAVTIKEIEIATGTGKTFVCVGPNRGDCKMADMLFGHDQFYFFEPMPDAAAWLRKSNEHAKDLFHVVEAACGEQPGRAKFRCYNDGLSSSLGVCTKQAVEHFTKYDMSLQDEIEVDVINLGEWLDECRIGPIETLMIDAQGMDLTIMKTIRPYLERKEIKTLIHEIDCDGFRHYEGLPDNSFSAAVEFMESVGGYRMDDLPEVHPVNFDVTWRVNS
jgi:FkbM family methyltransferase